MGSVLSYLTQVLALSGPLWTFAMAGAFIAGIGERAYPNEGAKPRGFVGVLAGLASLITPFLLFLHAFWAILPAQGGQTITVFGRLISGASTATAMALFALMALLIITPPVLGVATAKAAPGLGKVLYAASPALNLLVLALSVYATHDSVVAVFEAVTQRPI